MRAQYNKSRTPHTSDQLHIPSSSECYLLVLIVTKRDRFNDSKFSGLYLTTKILPKNFTFIVELKQVSQVVCSKNPKKKLLRR